MKSRKSNFSRIEEAIDYIQSTSKHNQVCWWLRQIRQTFRFPSECLDWSRWSKEIFAVPKRGILESICEDKQVTLRCGLWNRTFGDQPSICLLKVKADSGNSKNENLSINYSYAETFRRNFMIASTVKNLPHSPLPTVSGSDRPSSAQIPCARFQADGWAIRQGTLYFTGLEQTSQGQNCTWKELLLS